MNDDSKLDLSDYPNEFRKIEPRAHNADGLTEYEYRLQKVADALWKVLNDDTIPQWDEYGCAWGCGMRKNHREECTYRLLIKAMDAFSAVRRTAQNPKDPNP